METNRLLWLIALPLAAGPLIYLLGRLRLRLGQSRIPASRWLAHIALAATWAPFALLARDFSNTALPTFTLGAVSLRMDGLSLLVAALALALGTLVVLFSGPDMAGRVGEEKNYAIVVAVVGALSGLACASDLFNLWVWFELMAVMSYLLVSFDHRRPAVLEAGVKYLVHSASGSA